MLRFSRTSEVVETLVVESKEDRGEDIELRACDEELGELRRREPFSESSRRSCSRGDIVAVGRVLRYGDLQGSRNEVVADRGECAGDGVELPVHNEGARGLKARRRGLRVLGSKVFVFCNCESDVPADASSRL